MVTHSVVQRIAREIYTTKELPWLRLGDRLEWQSFVDDAGDCIFLRGILTYRELWRDIRYAEVEIPNKVLRMLSYQSKSAVVDVIGQAAKDVVELLRDPVPRLFPELCSLATQDEAAADVLVDALLEAGELTPRTQHGTRNPEQVRSDLRERAQRYAFMTMAELICGGWQSTPWPGYVYQAWDNTSVFVGIDNATWTRPVNMGRGRRRYGDA